MSRHLLVLVALLALALLAPGAPAQSLGYTDHKTPPDLPGVERIDDLIEAFNSSDPELIEACIVNHFTGRFAQLPPEEHVRAWSGIRSEWGETTFVSVRTYDEPRDDLIVILWADLIEAYRAFILPVGEDGKFTMLQPAPARPPSFAAPLGQITLDEAIERLDGLITKWADADVFSGTVIIAKDGRPIYERAVGQMCRRYDVPNNMETKFNLGSMNKMFTAVAIAQLEERGKLRYTDLVADHLPDYPNEAVRDKVQIRHLLTHTSGMGSHFTDELLSQNLSQYRSLEDFIDTFAETELAFEPGTDSAYSNAGFYVLGAIVEAASGQDYFEYCRENIYKPAGMKNTDAYDMDVPVKNLAIGYTREHFGAMPDTDGQIWMEEAGGVRNNLFMHPIKGGPAGGGFSTTPDLIAFANALQNGKLVSSRSLETLTSRDHGLPNNWYGFGFSVDENDRTGKIFGHSGGFPGINGDLSMLPDEGIAIAVLANIDNGAGRVSERFIRLYDQTKPR